MATLLIAGCSTVPSNVDVQTDQLVIPAPVGYTAAQQRQAYDERVAYCKYTPMTCRMIDDYGRERDLLRVARGGDVDVER